MLFHKLRGLGTKSSLFTPPATNMEVDTEVDNLLCLEEKVFPAIVHAHDCWREGIHHSI